MLVFLLACIASFVPSVGLFLWLRNAHGREEAFRKLTEKALVRGLIIVFPVILLSAIFHIILRLTGLEESNPLLAEGLHAFIVLALAEEIAKFTGCTRLLKENDYPYSWMDVTILMAIVATGFALIESVVYSFGASVPVVLVRGLTLPHVGYGFVVGYFYGKALKSGQPFHTWIGFGFSWFIHGLYDFSLSEQFLALNDNLVVIPFAIVAVDIALVVMLIRFVLKAKKDQTYQAPLPR